MAVRPPANRPRRRPGKVETRGPSTELQIINRAIKWFSEVGYQETSLEVIAQELGITRPAFYYYFKSKEDLLWRIIGDLGEHLRADTAPIAAEKGRGLDRLERMLTAHGQVMFTNADAFRIYFAEAQLVDRRRHRSLRQGEDQYLSMMAAVIQDGQRQGDFRVGDARVLARMAVGLVNSVLRWYSPQGRIGVNSISKLAASVAVSGIRRLPKKD